MPALIAVSNTSAEKPRVITVSSNGAYLHAKLLYETFVDGPGRRKLSDQDRYCQSKFVRTRYGVCHFLLLKLFIGKRGGCS
jgi:hypothetical protein